MRLAMLTLMAAIASAGGLTPALADEPVMLKLRPKSALIVATPVAKYAPFVDNYREEFPEVALRAEAESKDVPNSCSAADSHSLCYDYKRGRAVFKPTRNWMPDIPGMHRESITLKRDKLAFNYSFR